MGVIQASHPGQDILTVDPVHIMDINVEQTWLGGKLVYERR